MLPFLADIDTEKRVHVQSPNPAVFLCGGAVSETGDPPVSGRDVLYNLRDFAPFKDKDVFLAERFTQDHEIFGVYDNILEFEADLAQIVDLIILFCESDGSLAELGAFAMIDEISARLFVIVAQKHWEATSFIRLGPLKKIENGFGRELIHIFNDQHLGIAGRSYRDVNKDVLRRDLEAPVLARLKATREPTSLDVGRSGHVIKLITGGVQEYGALTQNEIKEFIAKFNTNIEDKHLKRFLHCAVAVGWLIKKSSGVSDYYIESKLDTDAATIPFRHGPNVSDKVRRRFLIRQHWKEKDSNRWGVISQNR